MNNKLRWVFVGGTLLLLLVGFVQPLIVAATAVPVYAPRSICDPVQPNNCAGVDSGGILNNVMTPQTGNSIYPPIAICDPVTPNNCAAVVNGVLQVPTPVPPTPRPTDTPIPPVATATPQPAPTLFPTCAAGIMLAGTGGQGAQCGPTITPIPPAATATPRATDTPQPTATPQTVSSNATFVVFGDADLLTCAAATTCYVGATGIGATEAAAGPLSVPAITFTKMYVKVAPAPDQGGHNVTFTVRNNLADGTITCVVVNTATTCNDTAHSDAITAGNLVDVKMVVDTGANTITNVAITLST